jgi:DNA end-binding protein Ku
MPRAIWSGSISFGLVNIPVKLFNAVKRKTVHFNQLDDRTKSRIKQKRVSAEDGSEVPPEHLVKGYELTSGNYVIVTEDELAALDPVAQRTIDIIEFVDLADIDPVFYDSAYYLAPDPATVKPYALLAEAMEREQKVGIAKFVMRTKEYLAAVRPQDGKLVLSTMVYHDEVVDPADLPELTEAEGVDVADRELDMAAQLIESLSADFDPTKYNDSYRNQVLELIERKAAGEEEVVLAPSAPQPEKVIDLMAALEASVKEAKDSRKRHPSGKEADQAKPAKKRAAKKKAAKKSPAKAAAKRKSA